MTPQELAALLNGREYMAEIAKHEEAEAKAAGLVTAAIGGTAPVYVGSYGVA